VRGAIDIYAELLAHWHATGPLPTHLRERLHAYLIHIGLDAIAYCISNAAGTRYGTTLKPWSR
jgi:hypothetical protein